MLEKLSSLYKRGLLNGPHFNYVLEKIAQSQLEKKAASSGFATKLLPSEESVGLVIDMIANAKDRKDVLEAAESMEYVPGSGPALQAKIDVMTRKVKDAGGTIDLKAETKIQRAVNRRLRGLLHQKPGLLKRLEGISRAGHTPLYAGLLGGLGLVGLQGYNYAKDKYDEYNQEKVLNNILIEHRDLDISKARDNFRALQHVAPNLASNKAIASGFIKRMNDYDSLDLAPISMAADIRGKLDRASSDRTKGFSSTISKDLVGPMLFGGL